MTDISLLLFALALSGAVVILAGAVLILAGVRAESVTEGSRQRLVGMGHLFFYFGTATWAIAVIISVIRLINSQY